MSLLGIIMLIERDWKLPIPRRVVSLCLFNFFVLYYWKGQRAVNSKRHLMEIVAKYLPCIPIFP